MRPEALLRLWAVLLLGQHQCRYAAADRIDDMMLPVMEDKVSAQRSVAIPGQNPREIPELCGGP